MIASAAETDLRITEVNLATGEAEVTNTGAAFTQTGVVTFCHRFNYGTTIASGTAWTAGQIRVVTIAGLNLTDSDLWLYHTPTFTDGNNQNNGLKWGSQTNVGRMPEASSATPKRWPDTTSFLPVPGAGQTLAWNGGSAGPANWYVDSTPSMGSVDAASGVGSLPTDLAWEGTTEDFEGMALGDSVDALLGWTIVGGNANYFVRAVNDTNGSPTGPPTASTRWLRMSDFDPTTSSRYYSNPILAPSAPADYTWGFWFNIEEMNVTGTAFPRITIQHDDGGFQNAWGLEFGATSASLIVLGIGGTGASTPFYTYGAGATAIGQWVFLEIEADLANDTVSARINGGGEVSLPTNLSGTANPARFRFCVRGEGTGNTSVLLVDDVSIDGNLPVLGVGTWQSFD